MAGVQKYLVLESSSVHPHHHFDLKSVATFIKSILLEHPALITCVKGTL